MRNTFSILFSICVFVLFVNCDGRKRHQDSLVNSIKEMKTKRTLLGKIKVIPEHPVMIITDTTTYNGFNVKLKNYSQEGNKMSLMNSTAQEDVYHRQFEAKIEVQFESHQIAALTLNSANWELRDESNFWNRATLQHVWVDQEQTNDDLLTLGVSFIDPKNAQEKEYAIVLNTLGERRITVI